MPAAHPNLKPWPADAMMVVAPNTGSEIRDAAEPTTLRMCRDCGTELTVRLSTIAAAEADDKRWGRPINFFCIPCAVQHEHPEFLRDLR